MNEGISNNIGSIVGSAVVPPKSSVEAVKTNGDGSFPFSLHDDLPKNMIDPNEVAQNTVGTVEAAFIGHDDVREMPKTQGTQDINGELGGSPFTFHDDLAEIKPKLKDLKESK